MFPASATSVGVAACAPVAVCAWTRSAYGCVDRLDARGFSAHFAADIAMRFGNAPPVHGRDSAYAAFHQFFARITSLTHLMTREWRVDGTPEGTALLLESEVTYITDSGGTCTVPATSSWRLRVEADGVERAHWLQICVDLAPLFALLAQPAAAHTAVHGEEHTTSGTSISGAQPDGTQ